RRPAPSARATAEETPAPMPLLVVCRTIITQGNAREAPASALVPMRPRKNPSNVMTPANASRVRMFGAARRSNVGSIAPSSSSLVRAAATGEDTVFSGAEDDAEIAMLLLLIGGAPPGRTCAALDDLSFARPGSCVRARCVSVKRDVIILSGALTAID